MSQLGCTAGAPPPLLSVSTAPAASQAGCTAGTPPPLLSRQPLSPVEAALQAPQPAPAPPAHVSPTQELAAWVSKESQHQDAGGPTQAAMWAAEDSDSTARLTAIEALRQRMKAMASDLNSQAPAPQERVSGEDTDGPGRPQSTDGGIFSFGKKSGGGALPTGSSFTHPLQSLPSFHSFRLREAEAQVRTGAAVEEPAEAMRPIGEEGAPWDANRGGRCPGRSLNTWEAAPAPAPNNWETALVDVSFYEAQRQVARMAEQAHADGWLPEQAQKEVARIAEQAGHLGGDAGRTASS